MIVLRSIGGLGNQMFEYAFARNVQLEIGGKLYIDIQAYDKYKIREFDLDKLNVKYEMFDNSTKSYPLIRFTQILYHCTKKLAKLCFNKNYLGIGCYKWLYKRGLVYNFDFCYYDTNFTKKKNQYIYGYFQSEKYFLKNRDIICKELKVKEPMTEKEKEIMQLIKENNSIGVSIRIGDDYVNDPLTYVCTKEYFYTCMRKMKEMVKEAKFFIFTDDISKVKATFQFPYEVVFVEGFNAIQSLRLLYSCKHFIISNSSFSWWGSYLSENIDKIVLSPARFSTDSSICDKDIYYDRMVKVDLEDRSYKNEK